MPSKNYTGAFTRSIDFTLSVTAGTYAANTLLGHKVTISGPATELGGSFLIESMQIYDKVNASASIDVLFFDSNPASTTFTDRAALTVDDNDLDKIVGIGNLTNYTAFAANGITHDKDLNVPFQMASGQNTLYLALVARTALSTAATTDFSGKINIKQN